MGRNRGLPGKDALAAGRRWMSRYNCPPRVKEVAGSQTFRKPRAAGRKRLDPRQQAPGGPHCFHCVRAAAPTRQAWPDPARNTSAWAPMQARVASSSSAGCYSSYRTRLCALPRLPGRSKRRAFRAALFGNGNNWHVPTELLPASMEAQPEVGGRLASCRDRGDQPRGRPLHLQRVRIAMHARHRARRARRAASPHARRGRARLPAWTGGACMAGDLAPAAAHPAGGLLLGARPAPHGVHHPHGDQHAARRGHERAHGGHPHLPGQQGRAGRATPSGPHQRPRGAASHHALHLRGEMPASTRETHPFTHPRWLAQRLHGRGEALRGAGRVPRAGVPPPPPSHRASRPRASARPPRQRRAGPRCRSRSRMWAPTARSCRPAGPGQPCRLHVRRTAPPPASLAPAPSQPARGWMSGACGGAACALRALHTAPPRVVLPAAPDPPTLLSSPPGSQQPASPA